jgi:hypothetical protein
LDEPPVLIVAGKIIELWDFPLPALITGGYMVFIYMCVCIYCEWMLMEFGWENIWDIFMGI